MGGADDNLPKWVIDQITGLLNRLGQLEGKVDMLVSQVSAWFQDHDKVMKAEGAAVLLKWLTTGLQGIAVLLLAWVASTVLDLRDAKTTTQGDIKAVQSDIRAIQETIKTRTFGPAELAAMQTSTASLISTVKETNDRVDELSQRVDDMQRAMLRSKPQINIHQPPASIIITRPDQSRSAPAGSTPGIINRLIHP